HPCFADRRSGGVLGAGAAAPPTGRGRRGAKGERPQRRGRNCDSLHSLPPSCRGVSIKAHGRLRSIRSVLDPKAFKAYDIRGVYPDELDEEGAYAIGRAFVEQFEPREIAVGRDMRLSSRQMQRAVIEGAADAGAEIADIGLG